MDQEIITCSKCQAMFLEEDGVKNKIKALTRLDCPVCGTFHRFIALPIIDPGAELFWLPGKYQGRPIREVYAENPKVVKWLATQKGRSSKAAGLYVSQQQQEQ